MLSVVKDEAYGHGFIRVQRASPLRVVSFLAVSTVEKDQVCGMRHWGAILLLGQARPSLPWLWRMSDLLCE